MVIPRELSQSHLIVYIPPVVLPSAINILVITNTTTARNAKRDITHALFVKGASTASTKQNSATPLHHHHQPNIKNDLEISYVDEIYTLVGVFPSHKRSKGSGDAKEFDGERRGWGL